MQGNLERIVAEVKMLPPQELERLGQVVAGLRANAEAAVNGGAASSERERLTRLWLEENRALYAGEWVALDGGQLISHGTDGRTVMAAAKASGVAAPFIAHLTEDELPFGGW